jgi:glycosyltransferase involved in cell wall biosynthesis
MKIGFASGDWSLSVFDENNHPVWGGAGWVRLGQYQKLIPHDVVAGSLCHRDGVFGVRSWDETMHFDCDIIVMQRIMFQDVADKMPAAIAAGQILVNDLDDWYWGLSPANGAWKASHPKQNPTENREHYRKVLARSSAVTVSTKYLADRLTWVNAPITVIKNTVDISRFTPRTHIDYVPTVGWVGSTMHRSGDIEILAGILGPLARNGQIKLHHSGHVEGARCFADMLKINPESVSTMPLVAPSEYPNSFVFDIGVVPLADVPFNHAKSWIKGIEYAAAGVPFIASRLPEYQELRDKYGIGLVAKNGIQWRKHIESLVDPNERTRISTEAIQKLLPLDIHMGAAVFTDFLESLV